MLIIPVKNAPTAEIAAINIGIASKGLLKNVSPPFCPEATSKPNKTKNERETAISLTDQMPGTLFGL
jgi:hypothetical protein